MDHKHNLKVVRPGSDESIIEFKCTMCDKKFGYFRWRILVSLLIHPTLPITVNIYGD